MRPTRDAVLILLLAAAFTLPGLRLAAQPAPGALVPYGPETPLLTGAQLSQGPFLAMDPAGVQLVWTRSFAFGQGEVWSQRFDRSGHPAGPSVRLDTPAALRRTDLTAVPLGEGRSAAVWGNFRTLFPGGQPTAGDPSTVSARLLGGDGIPLGPEIQLNESSAAEPFTLSAAPLRSGGFAASWYSFDKGSVVVRTFDHNAHPLTGEILLRPAATTLGALADGGFLASWWESGNAFARRFGPDGQPAGPAFSIDNTLIRPVIRPDGSFLTATAQLEASGWTVTARLWDAAGHRLGADIPVASSPGQLSADSVVVDDRGDFLVVWSDGLDPDSDESHVYARLYDTAGNPTGPSVLADTLPAADRYLPRAAADGRGDWLITWELADATVLARRFTSACATPDRTLCLQDNRFRVDVTWRNPRNHETGTGSAIPVSSDTGSFWFFNPDNLELTVKVLDGRLVNGHFWVFYASLSDVEFTITVTDTTTGRVRTFHNPPYTLASKADVTAF